MRNFRCLEHVDIEFEDVTTFLGPNGCGKSTILHALDWFFNGTRQTSLVADDVFQRDPGLTVEVAVEFDRLTDADHRQLGKYATPGKSSVLIRKVWDDGVEKTIGRGSVFSPFQDVRAGSSASERRVLYQELRASQPDLGLPAWTNEQMSGLLRLRRSARIRGSDRLQVGCSRPHPRADDRPVCS